MSTWELDALWLSVQVALLTVLLSAPVAVALASTMARSRWPGHWLIDAVVLLPMALPPAVLGYGLLVSLGERTAPGHWLMGDATVSLDLYPGAAVLAACLVTVPLMVRVLRPAFEAIDPMMAPLAQTLGASPWSAWWSITLPLAAPAVLSAVGLGLAAAWGETGATLVLAAALQPDTLPSGGDRATPATVPLAVIQALRRPDHAEGAARLALLSVAIAFVAILLSEAARRHWQGRWVTRHTGTRA